MHTHAKAAARSGGGRKTSSRVGGVWVRGEMETARREGGRGEKGQTEKQGRKGERGDPVTWNNHHGAGEER